MATITGIEGFAWTVKPKRNLNATAARADAVAAAEPAGVGDALVPPGVHAATAAAAADMSA